MTSFEFGIKVLEDKNTSPRIAFGIKKNEISTNEFIKAAIHTHYRVDLAVDDDLIRLAIPAYGAL